MKLFYVALLAFITNNAVAQKGGLQQIIPGVGAGKIKIGMSQREAVNLVGSAFTERTYLQEMQEFKNQEIEFSIDSIVAFVIGFDMVLVFEGKPKRYPVHNMYFKNNKLVYLTLSSYSAPAPLLKKFVLNKGIHFYDKKAAVKKKLGNDFVSLRYGDYDGDHIYYKQGMEVTYDEGKLTVISIFKKDPNYLQTLADNSFRIKAEYAALEAFEKENEEEEEN